MHAAVMIVLSFFQLLTLLPLQATPEGQAVFDTLLKACFDVVWNGQSIVVVGKVQVDPPYSPAQCKVINGSEMDASIEASLERVQKIVSLRTP